MRPLTASLRREIARARVARFATASDGAPSIVPVCFVLRGNTLFHAIDAKPKRVPPERLRRVQNLQRNRRAVAIIDHYAEDWTSLWFVLLRGRARLLRRGSEHRLAIAALRRKYPQYRRMPLDVTALVIALDVERASYWSGAG